MESTHIIPCDLTHIDMSTETEVSYWLARFDTNEEGLRVAICEVGNLTTSVDYYFKTNGAGSPETWDMLSFGKFIPHAA